MNPLKTVQHKVEFHKLACKVLQKFKTHTLQSPNSSGRSTDSRLVTRSSKHSGWRGWSLLRCLVTWECCFSGLLQPVKQPLQRTVVSVTFCLFVFRRFRNTSKHLIFFFFIMFPDISRCAGSLIMMPELDWIMSSPCISPRKAQFHVWITFCKHENKTFVVLLNLNILESDKNLN